MAQTTQPELRQILEFCSRDPVERNRSERGDEAHSHQIVRWPFRQASGRLQIATIERQASLSDEAYLERWRRLSNVPPTDDIRKLIQAVADDPLSVFLG